MFIYLNVEPNEEKLQDCVIRAMSLALAVPYDDIVEMLYNNGIENECGEICMPCYSKLLDKLGYKMRSGNEIKVGGLASRYRTSVLLIRIEGHLTCAIDGNVYDIWDCRDKEVDCYWVIE